MANIEIDYEEHLKNYKELLFGRDFDSNKNKNRIRFFYYKLILKNFIHFIKAIAVSFPHIIRIVINMTKEMDFEIFADYIGLNFYIMDMMRIKRIKRIEGDMKNE
jgi:hypothetical protein